MRRVRWHDRRNGSSSGSASRLVQTPSAQLRRNLWPFKRRIRDHAKGQRRQHQDDNGRTGPVYAGLVRLFRLLRNAGGVDRSHSLGPAVIAAAFWRQWKTPRRRRAALIARGISGQLCNMAASGRGPWHLARSKALSVGLSNAYFKSLGLPALIEPR